MEFTTDNYITLAICFLLYSVIIVAVYINLKLSITKNRKNLEALRKEHDIFKEDIGNEVSEIKYILKEDSVKNKDDHEMIAKALGNVAINVGELRNEIIKLIR